jgi:phosphoserine phosphatase
MINGLPDTPEANARKVSQIVEPLARHCAGRPVFLVDGDRTLSQHDTSRDLLDRAGIDHTAIKRRFQQEGYVFSAFRFHAAIHLDLGEERFDKLCRAVAVEAAMHDGAIEFVAQAASVGPTFVVSAGIPRIWSYVLANHGLHGVGVIGGIEPRLPYVFGRSEKGQVASTFGRHTSVLVAVGDSDVDAEMLRCADHAVVVVNHRQNADLMPEVSGHPSLWQVVPQGTPHPGLPVLTFHDVAGLANANVVRATRV